MEQKFNLGDIVHINKILPANMSHFKNDAYAMVLKYSHNDAQAGNDWEHSYGLYIKNSGYSSWYHNSHLTLIKRGNWNMVANEKGKKI